MKITTKALILGVGMSLAVNALGAAGVASTSPSPITFTGRLSTSSGPVNGTVSVTFTVYDALVGGASHWTDTISLSANNGLVFAQLGTASNPLDGTVFAGTPRFLEIIVGNETLSPRLPLGSAPYSIRATTADSADTLGTLTPGQVVTRVTAGAGLSDGGSGGMVSLSVDTSTVQSRVTGTCTGSAISSIATDGTVSCQPVVAVADGVIGNEVTGATDNSLTRSGAGTAASPFTLAVNSAVVQSRVMGTCATGAAIRNINSDGSVTCEASTPAGLATFYRSGSLGRNASNQVAHVTVNVPGAGTLLATLSFGLAVKNLAIACNVPLKLSLTPGDLTVGEGFQNYFWPDSFNTMNSTTAYGTFVSSITAGFAVNAGTNTVYFNSGQIGAPNCADFFWTNVTLTVLYVPTSVFVSSGAP
jgi:hypothetical protein